MVTQSKIFLDRIKKFQKALQNEEVDGYLVNDPFELFYLTGMQLSLGYLFVFQNKCRLFVDGRYLEAALKQSPVSTEKLSDENQLKIVRGMKKIYFNGDKFTYSLFIHFQKMLRKEKIKLISKPEILTSIRLIKTKDEINKMKKSAEFAYRAYQFLRPKLKTGVKEKELAVELEIYCLKRGAEKMSFSPIIAFGKNTALPHHHPGEMKLKANDIALFDLGVVLDGYCSDMTRVDFVGKPDPKLMHLYEVTCAAQKAALAECRPGVELKVLDHAARKVMAKAGLEKYFIHGLGHGIGLEVHEYPRVKKDGADRSLKLEAGMAITIEPGLYLPRKGGIRYEDTIVITQNGYSNLYPEL